LNFSGEIMMVKAFFKNSAIGNTIFYIRKGNLDGFKHINTSIQFDDWFHHPMPESRISIGLGVSGSFCVIAKALKSCPPTHP
jgi:hypothetical protein